MKKIIVLVSILISMVGVSSCRSGPQAEVATPVAPDKNKSVYIEMVYDPALLVTYLEKQRVIEEFQTRIHALGFGIATTQDRADIILKITIDDLQLVSRNKRLMARTTFGLVKDAASMTYTASFIDNRTFDEITSKKGRVKTTKFFPTPEEIKVKFFSEMEDDVVQFMSESTAL